jgi:hypothetical protein
MSFSAGVAEYPLDGRALAPCRARPTMPSTGPRRPAEAGCWRLTAEQREALEKTGGRCPKASKLGTVEVETPLLSEKLTGSVYLAEPAPNGEAGKNPFNTLVTLYMVVDNPRLGVLVELAGEGELDPETSLRPGRRRSDRGGSGRLPVAIEPALDAARAELGLLGRQLR